MTKRILKLHDAKIVGGGRGQLVCIGRLAEDDTVRGWPVGQLIRTSLVLHQSDGVNVGSRIETLNTIYEVVG